MKIMPPTNEAAGSAEVSIYIFEASLKAKSKQI